MSSLLLFNRVYRLDNGYTVSHVGIYLVHVRRVSAVNRRVTQNRDMKLDI
jgi:hypothetical protein